MCGRYTIHADAEQIIRRFLLGREPPAMRPRYNVAPTQDVPVVRLDESGRRVVELMRWGLAPSWAPDPLVGPPMINARAESLADKPAFRDALKERRCLVIADGFYEWRRDGSGKTPFYIRRSDRQPFAFAGLWERWLSRDTGQELRTVAIITTEANELVAPIHDRMPVILSADQEAAWLDPASDTAILPALLRPSPAAQLECHPVSPRVNRPQTDDPTCIHPAQPETLF